MKATKFGVGSYTAITNPTGRHEGVAGRGRGVKKIVLLLLLF